MLIWLKEKFLSGILHVENAFFLMSLIKVEKILKGSLDSIPSPALSVKIQIIGEKIYLG